MCAIQERVVVTETVIETVSVIETTAEPIGLPVGHQEILIVPNIKVAVM